MTLDELIQRSRELVDTMSPQEREAMFRAQAESWARAEAAWPKPKFQYVDEVKVYASYKDYCND
jgi:hypothetical protein